MSIRIQRKRVKGWKMPPNTVSVTRPGKFGNPFFLVRENEIYCHISEDVEDGGTVYGVRRYGIGNIEDVLSLYSEWLSGELTYYGKYKLPPIPDPAELKGKNLACFCKLENPCHVDILLKLANE